MASEKQMAANKRNAAKSTGPRTIQGKNRSRMNAYRHGLSVRSNQKGEDVLGENTNAECELQHEIERERRQIASLVLLDRVHRERVRILSRANAPADSDLSSRVALALEQVAALARYERRIVNRNRSESACRVLSHCNRPCVV